MFAPIRWLRRVAAALGLVCVLLAVTPVIHDSRPVNTTIAPGILGDCGDGTCGFV